MPIVFACPKCKTGFQVPEHMAGQMCLCNTCQTKLRVPASRAAPAAVAAPRSTIWDDLKQDEWDVIAGKKPKQAAVVESADVGHGAARPGLAGYATGGLWRDGKKLVVAAGATFPNRCLKTNQATQQRVTRTLTYCPVWIWLLFGALGAALSSRKMRLELPIGAQWLALRWTMRLVGVAMIGLGFLVFAVSILVISGNANSAPGAILAAVGLAIMISGVLCTAMGNGFFIKATFIDEGNRHAWLKGVAPSFLASLPQWPGR